MAIVLDGTTGITTPAIDSPIEAADITGNIAAARITDALNASGSAPVYAARAWVNFNGTGTVAIRASGNVSSITDNSTGNYTVNFTTAMSDANFCANVSAGVSSSSSAVLMTGTNVTATGSLRFQTSNNSSVAYDPDNVFAAIFR
jgi:hypothetical protein